jgi:plastocyanin
MRRTAAGCLLTILVASSCATATPGGTSLSGSLNSTRDPLAPDGVPDDTVDLTGSAQVTVVVTDNAFTDRNILVSPGTEVVWVNEGRNDHNVRPAAEGPGPGWFDEVDVGTLADGGSGSVTFDGVGDFPYFCSFHGTARRGQRGRVIVVPN